MTTTTTAPARVAAPVAYNRVSRFRVTGNGLDADVERGVDRQAADANAYAELTGLGHVRHITDNDQSASEFAAKPRTGWPELLRAVRAGEVTHVLVWLLDRAVRQVRDVDDLLAACRVGGAVIVQTGTGSVIDPNNAESRLHAQIAAAVAEYEAAKMSLRQLRRKQADADAGRSHGGRRPFGFNADRTIRESEAVEVRRLVREALAGATLFSLAADLNARGIPTPTTDERLAKGKAPAPWTGPNLRHMLMGPHLAGLRVHRGVVHRTTNDDGKAAWDAIISEADHRRVKALLTDPRRRVSPENNARRHLLTGLAVCDACGLKVRSYRRTSYICPTGAHVQRSIEAVDMIVEGFVVGLLSRSTAQSLFADDTTAEELARLGAAEDANVAAVVEAKALRRDGRLTMAAYADLTKELEDDANALAAARAALELADYRDLDVVDGLTGAGASAAWDDLDLGRKRAVIARLVTVGLSSPKPRARMRPEDVDVRRRTA
jgi:DNA invertase Pin-like site-specific DNA recombinase